MVNVSTRHIPDSGPARPITQAMHGCSRYADGSDTESPPFGRNLGLSHSRMINPPGLSGGGESTGNLHWTQTYITSDGRPLEQASGKPRRPALQNSSVSRSHQDTTRLSHLLRGQDSQDPAEMAASCAQPLASGRRHRTARRSIPKRASSLC